MNNWYYGPEGGTAETRNYTAQYILGMLADDLIQKFLQT